MAAEGQKAVQLGDRRTLRVYSKEYGQGQEAVQAAHGAVPSWGIVIMVSLKGKEIAITAKIPIEHSVRWIKNSPSIMLSSVRSSYTQRVGPRNSATISIHVWYQQARPASHSISNAMFLDGIRTAC